MRAFLAGIAVMIIIAVAAWAALDRLPSSSAEKQTSERGSVRLGSGEQ